jgi:uncharacterized membrane protein YeaQ/YmgE (transglycosylase-associated protein family)
MENRFLVIKRSLMIDKRATKPLIRPGFSYQSQAQLPDPIVTDIGMPVVDVITATARILQRNLDARIVFVTVQAQTRFRQSRPRYTATVAPRQQLVLALQACPADGKKARPYQEAAVPSRRRWTMGILLWVVFGLIAGAIARFLMPGKASGGIILTILLGIVGAVVGGYVGTLLGFGDVTGFDLGSMALAVGGGVLVLVVFGLVTGGRART